jgi:hypothetical protein
MFLIITSLFISLLSYGDTDPAIGLQVGPGIFDMSQPRLRPFSSDGCSASPNGIPSQASQIWADCCVEHDRKYWKGGTEDERLRADEELYSCIKKKGYSNVALIYYQSVRVGRVPGSMMTYRWGYGWDQHRPYGVLSKEELAQVQALENQKEYLSFNIQTLLKPQDYFDSNIRDWNPVIKKMFQYLHFNLKRIETILAINELAASRGQVQYNVTTDRCTRGYFFTYSKSKDSFVKLPNLNCQ